MRRPADRVGQAKPVTGTATGEFDHNTPEEDALEKAALEANVMVHE